jgi:hypothetical protein
MGHGLVTAESHRIRAVISGQTISVAGGQAHHNPTTQGPWPVTLGLGPPEPSEGTDCAEL